MPVLRPFLITIDTEGDNAWAKPRAATTRNAAYLPRFQRLCERYGFKPTYLVNYEMANCAVFVDFARDALRRGAAEAGMHLHAWNSPPLYSLTADDMHFQPYLIEYPTSVIRDKVLRLTEILSETLAARIVSHRAGRWAFDSRYAQVLVDAGYLVDCSVTPHKSWARHLGSPDGRGGSDYRGFPDTAYFLDLKRIDRPGESPLLEVPMTVLPPSECSLRLTGALPDGVIRHGLERLLGGRPKWLRPSGSNREDLIAIAKHASVTGRPYAQFMLHSSELMPGGSPTFCDEQSIELLYANLEALFDMCAQHFAGATLKEYYEVVSQQRQMRESPMTSLST